MIITIMMSQFYRVWFGFVFFLRIILYKAKGNVARDIKIRENSVYLYDTQQAYRNSFMIKYLREKRARTASLGRHFAWAGKGINASLKSFLRVLV